LRTTATSLDWMRSASRRRHAVSKPQPRSGSGSGSAAAATAADCRRDLQSHSTRPHYIKSSLFYIIWVKIPIIYNRNPIIYNQVTIIYNQKEKKNYLYIIRGRIMYKRGETPFLQKYRLYIIRNPIIYNQDTIIYNPVTIGT